MIDDSGMLDGLIHQAGPYLLKISDATMRECRPVFFDYQRQQYISRRDEYVARDIIDAMQKRRLHVRLHTTKHIPANDCRSTDNRRELLGELFYRRYIVHEMVVQSGRAVGPDGYCTIVDGNGVQFRLLIEIGYMDSLRMFFHLVCGNNVLRWCWDGTIALIFNYGYAVPWMDLFRHIQTTMIGDNQEARS